MPKTLGSILSTTLKRKEKKKFGFSSMTEELRLQKITL
jgi:hypothetical protein